MNPKIYKTHNLKQLNSFSLSCVAEYFCIARCSAQLKYALDFAKKNKLNITILGEGTNVVLNQIVCMISEHCVKPFVIEPVEVIYEADGRKEINIFDQIANSSSFSSD